MESSENMFDDFQSGCHTRLYWYSWVQANYFIATPRRQDENAPLNFPPFVFLGIWKGCYFVHTWKFMCSQSTSSRHWQDFLAMCLDGVLIQHVSRVVSFLGTISPLGRCSCAAALSSLVRSSNTMECFLLVPLPLTFSFFTTKSSPRGAGTGFNCSEDRM